MRTWKSNSKMLMRTWKSNAKMLMRTWKSNAKMFMRTWKMNTIEVGVKLWGGFKWFEDRFQAR